MRRIQEYILAGDAFQVVYSQRFEVPRGDVDPFDVYRALRVINPSPYMFHLEFPEAVVTGASPEVLVRLDGGEVEVRPIAGTRRRGATPEEDAALEAELRADPKELAEHIMLIDLGRNDVGRVSVPGSGHPARPHGDGALLARHAPGLERARARAPGHPRRRRGAGLVPGRDAERRAQDPRHGDHRGAGAVAARDLRRRGRLHLVHGQHGSVDRHPDAGHDRGHDLRAGGRGHRRRQRPRRGVRGVPQQGARGGERGRDRAPRPPERGAASDVAGHRQLRFVHLQPRPVPGRARPGGAGRPQRRDPGGRDRGARPLAHRDLARALHAERGGHQPRRHQDLRGADPDPGRVPRTPVDRAGVRRADRARRAGHARQDLADLPRRQGGVLGPAEPVRGDALPLAAHRARERSRTASRSRPRPRTRRDHGGAAQDAAGRGGAVPSRSRS